MVVGIPAGSTCWRSRRTPMTYRSTAPTEVGGIAGGTRRGLRYFGIVDGSSIRGPRAGSACNDPAAVDEEGGGTGGATGQDGAT